MSKEMTINEKLSKIQCELKVSKSKRNTFGNYNFRSAEDILESVKPLLKELNCSIRIEEELIETTPFPILKSRAILSDGKDEVWAEAIVGVDLDQKGMQTAQKFGAASSYGKKYSMGNLMAIDDSQDADATNTHGKVKPIKEIEYKSPDKKEIPSEKIDNIKSAIANGKIKKDMAVINANLSKQGFKDLTKEQFNSL